MVREAYCSLYDKFLRDVTELQQEGCLENGLVCDECESFTFAERVVFDECRTD